MSAASLNTIIHPPVCIIHLWNAPGEVSSLVAPQTEVGGGFGWMNRELLPPNVFADSSRNEKEIR